MKIRQILSTAFLVCGLFLHQAKAEAQILDFLNDKQTMDILKSGFETQTEINPAQLEKKRQIENRNNINKESLEKTEKKVLSSRIENDYNRRLKTVFFKPKALSETTKTAEPELDDYNNQNLMQFGYDLFTTSEERLTQFGSLFNSVRDEYVLGVGDELVLTFRGQRSDTETIKVDVEGKVLLKNFMPFVALGRSFGDVKAQIEGLVKENLIKTDVFISLGAIKDLSVVVAGEVEKAGVYSLSGVANLFDALIMSGGIKKTGSLRSVEIIRQGRSKTIDLYNLLLGKGDIKDVILADGDRVVVPTIGRTVAVLGDVHRPFIFEIKQNAIKAEELLNFAGGTFRSSGYRYVTIAENQDGVDVILEHQKPDYNMKPSDILLVLRSRDAQVGAVSLEGHVNVAGLRSVISTPNISSIINGVEIFKDNPYLLFGVVQRRDKTTLARYFVPVDFSAVLEKKENLALEDGDKIIVLSRKDIDWLISSDIQNILNMNDEGKIYTCESLKQLSSMVRSGWTNRFASATRFVEKKPANKTNNKPAPTNNIGYSENIVEPQPMDMQLLKPEECPEVFEKYPDLLPFVLTNVINVNGEVNFAGIYPIASRTPVSSIVAVGGGLTLNADLASIEITRFSRTGEASAREVVNATQKPLTEVFVASNDAIRFNQMFSDRESGNVYLAGEFKRPGIYSVKKGEKLSEILARAGGVTEEAYTVGAVFTRESVRQAEYQIIETAIRNMNSGFMHSLASSELKNVSPTAVVAMMSELKLLLSDTEPLGRIVVEADPLKLQLRPELDIVMHPGDKIYMPKRPNHVLVSGEVLHSGAMQFISGRSPREYIKMAGGTAQSADRSRTFMVLPNGTAKPISISSWNITSDNIPPGSTIFVPRDTSPLNFMVFTKDVLDIVSKAAVTAASIKVLNK